MKRISFIGDSITEMLRSYSFDLKPVSYGAGFVLFVESELSTKYPKQFEIFNKAVGGRTIAHVYAGIKTECWNLKPDVVSLLVGVNDVEKNLYSNVGVEIDRYEKIYRQLLIETKKYCGDIPIILIEPFVLKGSCNIKFFDRENELVRQYAQVVRKIGEEFKCFVISIQQTFDSLAEKYSSEYLLYDGVHPTVVGSKIIAEKWLETFEQKVLPLIKE